MFWRCLVVIEKLRFYAAFGDLLVILLGIVLVFTVEINNK